MVAILLKISVILAVGLAFYKLMLQQESFFGANRVYFICCTLFAVAIPFVELPDIVKNQGFLSNWIENNHLKTEPSSQIKELDQEIYSYYQQETIETLRSLESISALYEEDQEMLASSQAPDMTKSSSPTWAFWIFQVYLFGVGVFSLNLLFQLGNILLRVYRSKDKIYEGRYTIVNMERKHSPCSFFTFIFIHPDDYDFATYEQIIAHEKTHCRLGHSFDLILAELMVIVLWFNPLAWIFKKEMEKNIEFQTDFLMVEKEKIKKDLYQLSLLQIAIPNKPLSITTNYNQSLLKQRIKMMNAKKSDINGYWKYAFVIPMFVGSALMLNSPANSQQVTPPLPTPATAPIVNQGQPLPATAVPRAQPAPQVQPAPQIQQAPVIQPAPDIKSAPQVKVAPAVKASPRVNIQMDVDMSKGYWYSHIRNNEYCLEFRQSSDKNNSWNTSRCFDITLFEKKGADVFVMARETGVLTLKGALDQEVSQGTYEFEPDREFEKYLSAKNLETKDRNYLFHLHLHEVNRQYIEFVTDNFPQIKGSQLLGFAIHEVDRNYLKEISQAGFPNLSPEKVLAAKIHGVKSATIKEIQALGFGDLSMDRIIELRIHQVDASYIKEIQQAGFKDLSLNEVVAAKIHKLNAESIANIRSLGLGDFSFNRMLEFQIHGVNAAFIRGLQEAGLQNLSPNEVLTAKIHGLNRERIKEIKDMGYDNLGFNKMLELQIHKVNAGYIQDLKDMGFTNVTLDEALRAKIHGVNRSFIKEAKEKGYNLQTLDEYNKVKIHGMTAERTKRKYGPEND